MRRVQPLAVFFLFFFCYFALFSFPRWYTATYTKLWELKQMVLQPRDTQMMVLHPQDQMSALIQLKHELATHSAQNIVLIFPKQTTLALTQNPAFVRGYLQSSLPGKKLFVSDRFVIEESQDGACFDIIDPAQAEFVSECPDRKGKL